MGRPVKWSRDLHPTRARAARARTETWSRVEIEQLFAIGRLTGKPPHGCHPDVDGDGSEFTTQKAETVWQNDGLVQGYWARSTTNR